MASNNIKYNIGNGPVSKMRRDGGVWKYDIWVPKKENKNEIQMVELKDSDDEISGLVFQRPDVIRVEAKRKHA